MPSYDDWNNALIDYFTSGVPRGASIFLDVNDDVLAAIGSRFPPSPAESVDWTEQFQQIVRDECVHNGRVRRIVSPGHLDSANTRPRCVAFLAAMVLAAYRMADDDEEGMTSTDYFRRLREVLGLPDDDGRPQGMEQGRQEEEYWNEWGYWLQRAGFLPTAQSGEGPQRYIRLPISQSILRQADRDRLFTLFENSGWPRQLDAELVGLRLRRETIYLWKHIQRLLQQNDEQRYRAINQAIFEVYEEWALSPPGRSPRVQRQLRGTLAAGLYRVADPFLDTVAYYLYPQQSRRLAGDQIAVKKEGELVELVEQRPGWYTPLWPLQLDEISHGVEYELVGDPSLKRLVVAARNFRILIPDPENPESGVYASWGRPELGTRFILLCKDELVAQIEHLRDERLVEWSGEPVRIAADIDWIEFRGMMVVSEAWDGFSGNNDLYDSLRPIATMSVHFTGGIRAPNRNAWLVGFAPAVTVIGFYDNVQLTVQSVDGDRTIFDEEIPANQEQSIPWASTGDYRVEVSVGTTSSELRLVKIINWDELSWEARAEIDKEFGTQFGTDMIYGPLVRKVEQSQ